MPRIDLDFENIDKPVEAGMYPFEITGSQMKATKTDGSTMVMWELTVIAPGPSFGRKLFYNSNLSDQAKLPDGNPDTDRMRKANFYMLEFLKTVGAPWDTKGFTTEMALHCKGIAKVTQEMYNGRPVARVDEILPFSE